MLFRPFMNTPEPRTPSRWVGWFRHPLFAYLGVRPVFAQHTPAEHRALMRWAAGRSHIVEIGVAEGGSACALAEAMSASATLTLIDPFSLSRCPAINATKRVARAVVSRAAKGRVQWIEQLSSEAVRNWKEPIDLLFVDGDHREAVVLGDWTEWHPFVAGDGVVIFHDARVFPNGWPDPSDGPVKVVSELFRGVKTSPKWKIVEEVHSLVVVRRMR